MILTDVVYFTTASDIHNNYGTIEEIVQLTQRFEAEKQMYSSGFMKSKTEDRDAGAHIFVPFQQLTLRYNCIKICDVS